MIIKQIIHDRNFQASYARVYARLATTPSHTACVPQPLQIYQSLLHKRATFDFSGTPVDMYIVALPLPHLGILVAIRMPANPTFRDTPGVAPKPEISALSDETKDYKEDFMPKDGSSTSVPSVGFSANTIDLEGDKEMERTPSKTMMESKGRKRDRREGAGDGLQ